MTQPSQELIECLDSLPKDEKWHLISSSEDLILTTYIRWDSDEDDWRFITLLPNREVGCAGYVGINKTNCAI